MSTPSFLLQAIHHVREISHMAFDMVKKSPNVAPLEVSFIKSVMIT